MGVMPTKMHIFNDPWPDACRKSKRERIRMVK